MDLGFSSVRETNSDSVVECILPFDAFYSAVSFHLPFFSDSSSSSSRPIRRNFGLANYSSINDHIIDLIDWEKFEHLYVEDALSYVYDILNEAIDLFVPLYIVKRTTFPAWFTEDLISLIRAKKLAYLRYKQSNQYADYLVFSELRVNCKVASNLCWKSY